MEEESTKEGEVPLIGSRSSGNRGAASEFRTLGNIIVSVVGTGILGLPYALKVSGWLAGSVGVATVGIATCYCMLLLVQCRDSIASEEECTDTITYGYLGYKCMGNAGRYFTEFLVSISQCGGAIAYLIFIGQNLSAVLNGYGFSYSFFVFALVPVEIVLSWIESLSSLAFVSIFADMCNVLAMIIVVKEDVQQMLRGEFNFSRRKLFDRDLRGLLFAVGMAVFCFEGFGMTLALEASMINRGRFGTLLAKAFSGITFSYILFGFSGYMAYGDDTRDIICLNLPHNWSARVVQIGLCLALIFTFPIMLHPIREIVEEKLSYSKWFQRVSYRGNEDRTKVGTCLVYSVRSVLVLALAAVASYVPKFGVFASLVGSTVCCLLSFVLPATFHLMLCGKSLSFWRSVVNYVILLCGVLVAIYGTYNAISNFS